MKINEVLDEIIHQIQQPLWENWYIDEQIGSGAFSAVYRIQANRRNRIDTSALNIEPIIAGDNLFLDDEKKLRYIEKKRESVENEAAILYKLRDCKNIVSYEEESIRRLEIDRKFEGYYFLIRMELLDCLTTLIKERRFDFSEASIVQLAKDIGNGIAAAHAIGIIHRDIKPSNFFRSHDGIYKLGDFNISKESDTAMTFAGTEGYLAPEIYRAKLNVRESYTKQADIYSFGICLYQLMNNLCFPFETDGISPEAFQRRMKGEAFEPPVNASPAFARIIMKACSFQVADRYATIDEMLHDLELLKPAKSSAAGTAVRTEPVSDKKKSVSEPMKSQVPPRSHLSVSSSLVIKLGDSEKRFSQRADADPAAEEIAALEARAESGDKEAQKQLILRLKMTDKTKANRYAQKYHMFGLLI